MRTQKEYMLGVEVFLSLACRSERYGMTTLAKYYFAKALLYEIYASWM